MKHYPNWTPRRRLLAICAITCVAAIGIPSWRLVARETQQKEDAAADRNRGPEKPAPRGAGEESSARGRPDTRPADAAKDTINAIGRITAPTIEIRARSGGMVRDTNLQDGRRVKRGELVVQLDDDVDAAQIVAAEADLRLKAAVLDRITEQYKKGETSAAALDEARANAEIARVAVKYRQAVLAEHRITAPFEGVIANARAQAGQVVAGGDSVLATLMDLDHPAVEFSVTERLSTQIVGGARVTVNVPALERKFTGRVAVVAPQVNPETGTVAVKATLDGAIEGLKPGMFARITVEPGQPTTRDAGK